jgi:predicted RNase H-like HicB family nuclease
MRKHYIALVQAGPSAYGMSFPDFPGVVTATRAINAAVERAAKMLTRHVEGMLKDGELIPPPCSFEDVRKLAPNYQDAMLAHRQLVNTIASFGRSSATVKCL